MEEHFGDMSRLQVRPGSRCAGVISAYSGPVTLCLSSELCCEDSCGMRVMMQRPHTNQSRWDNCMTLNPHWMWLFGRWALESRPSVCFWNFSFLFHFHPFSYFSVFAVWSSLWQSGKQSLFKSQPASSWKNIKFQLNTMIDVNYNVLRTQGLIAEGVGTNWGGARSMLQTWLRWRSGSSWIRGLAVIRACVLHSCPTAASIHMESPKFFCLCASAVMWKGHRRSWLLW